MGKEGDVMDSNQKRLERLLIELPNNKERLADIYDVTYGAIFSFVYNIVKNRDTAKDVTHDVYLAIYKHSNQYEAKGHPMAWMYAIAKNTAKMYLRKHTKEVTVEEDIEIAYHQQDVISNVTVQYLLQNLELEEREIVVMRSISDMPFKDIAKVLDMRLSTVLSKYHRAIKKLKKEVLA